MAACNRDLDQAEMQPTSSQTSTKPSQPWSFGQAIGRFRVDTGIGLAKTGACWLLDGSLLRATAGKDY
jgi:hypothetical protein